jgi:hypothetical protein
MKTKFKSSLRAACLPFGGAVCAGAVMLIASSTQAQNLFVDTGGSSITEITPGGGESTFASGLYGPAGLAFNSAGDLFEADEDSGNINEFTPGGVRTTFASGLSTPAGLAFNNAGDLFVASFFGGSIYEYTPGGSQSTFVSGLAAPTYLAFQGETLPVPEPSALGLLAVGITAVLVCRRR